MWSTAANAVAGAAGYITGPWDRFTRWLRSVMPHGLYARALLIIIMPLVVLQSIVAFLFVERQSSVVTFYLSSAVTQEIATLIDVYKTFPPGANRAQLRRIAQDRLGLVVDFLPGHGFAAARPEAVLLVARPGAVGRNPQADRPAVLDRHRRPLLDRGNPHQARRHRHARVRAARRRLQFQFAEIFLMWMVLTSLVVLTIAIAVPAQPDQADRAACRRRRSLRQGPRGAEFPPARRARGAARGGGVLGNEDAHRARRSSSAPPCSPACRTICARC